MTIWAATGNRHKLAELAAVFGERGHALKTPADAGIAGFDAAETGGTFLENALIKARELRGLLAGRGIDAPVLADDSGLCVDALDGRPGIYSARYAGAGRTASGKKLTARERNALLLEELGDAADRSARFVCAMALLLDERRFFAAQETLEGEIVRGLSRAAGDGGFGYDPIVYLPGLRRTAAELSEAEKNSLSHRGKAARAIASLLAGD
ncbi:MAG: non-canonical purine NTP pyrophosphatase, RdgB/HAM1 family [Treponematales bacterium]